MSCATHADPARPRRIFPFAHGAPARDDAAMPRHAAALLAALILAACANVRYDLAAMPFPVLATPRPADAPAGQAFEVKQKYILWGYGLFGEKQPDVAGALRGDGAPTAAVHDFRVSASANLWDWLGTHLSLGLVRLRTVKVAGVRVAAPAAR